MTSNADSLNLSSLFPEIIDRIVDHFPPKYISLDPISRISKSFLEPCQRRLLSEIGLFGGFHRDPEKLPGKALLSLLTDSPHLARYVTSLAIYIPVNTGSAVPTKDFWIWYDTYLPASLDMLQSVRYLNLSKPLPDPPISHDLPLLLKASLARIVEKVVSVELGHLPTTFLPLALSPSTIHLSWKCRSGMLDDTTDRVGTLSVLRQPRLESLALLDVGAAMDEMGRWKRLVRSGDVSFIHRMDLSHLRRLYFGTCGTLPEQGDLLKTLGQCRDTLEELRVAPDFNNGKSAVKFLRSHSLPTLACLPSLRRFEACIYAAIDISERLPAPGQPDVNIMSIQDWPAMVHPGNGQEVLHALASWFETASPHNHIEQVTLYVYFVDDIAFPLKRWISRNYDGSIEVEDAPRFKREIPPLLSRRVGLDAIDHALASAERFPRLSKVTFVVAPMSQNELDPLGSYEETSEVYREIFQEFQLMRNGKLEILYPTQHRAIDNVDSWHRSL